MSKKVKNGWKKGVHPVLGCAQHPKAGWNTQQPVYPVSKVSINYNVLQI